MVERDLDLLPVEIAGEVEEMRLQQFLGRLELRAHADIGRTLEYLTGGEHAAGHRVDAEPGSQIVLDREIRRRIADIAPALVAMLDHAANREGAGEERSGGLRIALAQRLADAAGRNRRA